MSQIAWPTSITFSYNTVQNAGCATDSSPSIAEGEGYVFKLSVVDSTKVVTCEGEKFTKNSGGRIYTFVGEGEQASELCAYFHRQEAHGINYEPFFSYNNALLTIGLDRFDAGARFIELAERVGAVLEYESQR